MVGGNVWKLESLILLLYLCLHLSALHAVCRVESGNYDCPSTSTAGDLSILDPFLFPYAVSVVRAN